MVCTSPALSVAVVLALADCFVAVKAASGTAREVTVKGYSRLYFIGFAVIADARADIDAGEPDVPVWMPDTPRRRSSRRRAPTSR